FPSRARHPVRALDDKAMELTSSDAELRAALFRLVDVTPACRSLDDLATHLAGFLAEVQDRPPSLETAMRMSHTKPGRLALGAAGRLRPLVARARELGAHIHIDMESVDALETTLELVFELLDEDTEVSAGVVLQAYLRDSPAHLDRILESAAGSPRATPPVVR